MEAKVREIALCWKVLDWNCAGFLFLYNLEGPGAGHYYGIVEQWSSWCNNLWAISIEIVICPRFVTKNRTITLHPHCKKLWVGMSQTRAKHLNQNDRSRGSGRVLLKLSPKWSLIYPSAANLTSVRAKTSLLWSTRTPGKGSSEWSKVKSHPCAGAKI